MAKKEFTKKEKKEYAIKKNDNALEEFAEMMIEKIKTIQDDWNKPWFTNGALFQHQNLGGRFYNGGNQIILSFVSEKMGYTIPVWCTHERVSSLNFEKDKQGVSVRTKDENGKEYPFIKVNKGEKSHNVWLTIFNVKDKDGNKIKYSEYCQLEKSKREEYKVYPSQQVYNVFNIEQTNLKDARPDLWEKFTSRFSVPENVVDCNFSFSPMDYVIKENLWICPIKPTYGDDAYYSISKNKIVIPEKKQFKDGESFYSNLFHEMAHSTGSEKYLNRLKPSSFGSAEYAKEELVAELTAAVVSANYGMHKNIKKDSCSYMKCWLNKLKEDATYIRNIFNDVKKASAMITECISNAEYEDNSGK